MNVQTPAAFAQGFITSYMQGMQMSESARRFDAQMQLQAKREAREDQYRNQMMLFKNKEFKADEDWRKKQTEQTDEDQMFRREQEANDQDQLKKANRLNWVKTIGAGIDKFMDNAETVRYHDAVIGNMEADNEENKRYHDEMTNKTAPKVEEEEVWINGMPYTQKKVWNRETQEYEPFGDPMPNTKLFGGSSSRSSGSRSSSINSTMIGKIAKAKGRGSREEVLEGWQVIANLMQGQPESVWNAAAKKYQEAVVGERADNAPFMGLDELKTPYNVPEAEYKRIYDKAKYIDEQETRVVEPSRLGEDGFTVSPEIRKPEHDYIGKLQELNSEYERVSKANVWELYQTSPMFRENFDFTQPNKNENIEKARSIVKADIVTQIRNHDTVWTDKVAEKKTEADNKAHEWREETKKKGVVIPNAIKKTKRSDKGYGVTTMPTPGSAGTAGLFVPMPRPRLFPGD